MSRLPSALTLFADLPGWEAMPTPARVLAHAKAHPFALEDVDEDVLLNCPAGLWMVRDAKGTGLVALMTNDPARPDNGGRGGPVWCTVPNPVFPCRNDDPQQLRACEGDGDDWLPLDAEGRPLGAGGRRRHGRPGR